MTDASLTAAAPADSRSRARERVHAALRSGTLIVGSVILLFWIACALFGSDKFTTASDNVSKWLDTNCGGG